MCRAWATWIACALLALPADVAARASGDPDGDGPVVVACLGDSNTQSDWQGFPDDLGWCEFLELVAPSLGVDVVVLNAGIGGAIVQPSLPHLSTPIESYSGSFDGNWALYDGHGQLGFAIESLAPLRIDFAIAAFGTNDVLLGSYPLYERATDVPADIVRWYEILRRSAAAAGIRLLVAKTPARAEPERIRLADGPDTSLADAAIDVLNEKIDGAFPPELIIDFRDFRESGRPMDPSLYMDELHFNQRGQFNRALEAATRLANLVRREHVEARFLAAGPADDGYETAGAAPVEPKLSGKRIFLGRNQRHFAGLRLTGDVPLVDLSRLSAAELVLPLAEPIPRARTLAFRVELLGANIARFDRAAPGDISGREAIASRIMTVEAQPGMTALRLGGPEMADLVAEALASQEYAAGGPNSIGFRISRSDRVAIKTTIVPIEAGHGPYLWVCFGGCSDS